MPTYDGPLVKSCLLECFPVCYVGSMTHAVVTKPAGLMSIPRSMYSPFKYVGHGSSLVSVGGGVYEIDGTGVPVECSKLSIPPY